MNAPSPSTTTTQATTHATVAVVMRTKNRLLLLHRALSSVLFQTHTAWHLYLVNDGGNQPELERTLALYRPLFGTRLSVLHHSTSQGMEAASNAALAHVTEAFFAIHDDDDTWHPDFLKHSVAFLTNPENTRFLAVTTGSVVVHEEIKNDIVHELSREEWCVNRETIDFTKLLYANLFPPISLLMRTSLLQSIGTFNAALPVLGDWDYNIRIMQQGDIGYIKDYLAFYHRRSAGTHSVYSNTITNQADQHTLYNILIRNQKLRESLRTSPQLLGLAQGLIFSMQHHNAPLYNGLASTSQQLQSIETALHHINNRLASIELTSMWVHKLLRPLYKVWHLALPARRLVAKLRGRA